MAGNIILSILLIIVVAVCVALWVKNRKLNKCSNLNISSLNQQVEKLDKSIYQLKQDRNQLNNRLSNCEQEKNQLNKRLGSYEQEKNQLQKQLSSYEQTLGTINDAQEEIEKLQVEKNVLIESIQKEKETIEKERATIKAERQLHLEDSNNRIQSSNQEIENAEKRLKEINNKVTELNKRSEKLDQDIQAKLTTLDSLAETHKTAIFAAEKDNISTIENGFEVTLLPQYERVVTILRELSATYPELSADLSKIEWSKVWMPQFQQKLKTQKWKDSCIYRLVLKEDPNICYVGQAKDIKDRWYQHAKKMLGVDSKGNERLYNYHPEDFIWTVIEDNVTQRDLDNKEHYWINYYACLSVGLNKRK